ncbi:Inositol polyphosphate multikinase beta, partial [Toxocara canis]
FIKEKGSEFLLKPVQDGVRGQCEIALYNWVNDWLTDVISKASTKQCESDRRVILKFTEFVPKYFGLKTIRIGSKGYIYMHCVEGEPPRIRDKLWGRSRSPENIVDAYGEFLSGRQGEERKVTEEVLSQLNSIREWFMEQRIYHFFASSILIIFEACKERPPRVCVRLIDFSHVFPAEEKRDENYLFGLSNMITFIKQFRDRLSCPS